MNKTLLTTLTMVVCLAPSCFYWFNIPFTFSPQENCTPHAAHQCALHQLKEHASIPFGSDFGKFIKESQQLESEYQIKTIVLDAGHGGRDPGCSGKKSKEKNIALGIALKLGQKLQRNYPELRVIYTRDRDVFVPLHKRATIANDNDADLFISIHCNYIVGSTATRGSETYVMGLHTSAENLAVAKRENEAILFEEDYRNIYDIDPNSDAGHILYSYVQNMFLEQSLSFASKVEDQIASYENRRSRGVKQAGFQVLRQTSMPSVLVETGFLSNSQEENYLLTHAGQQSVAESVFRAFQDYKHEVEDYSSKPIANAAPVYEVQSPMPSPKSTQQRPTPSPSYDIPPPAARQPTTTPVVVHQPINTTPTAPKAKKKRVSRASIDWGTADNTSSTKDEVPIRESYAVKTSNTRDMHAKSPVEFRVQITASPTLLNQRTGRWLELNKLDYLAEPVWENGQHKYQIMALQSLDEAESIRLQMREIGFFNAFVIAYQGAKHISIDDAIKLQRP